MASDTTNRKRQRGSGGSVFQEAPKEHLQEEERREHVGKWYLRKESERTVETPTSIVDVKNFKAKAEKLYSAECRRHRESLGMTRSDQEWFEQVTARGTTKDKIAAYAMAVQDGVFQSLPHLEALLGIAKSGNRHEALPAVESLKDALVGNEVLPKTRKLYYIHQRPLETASGPEDATLWYFEDRLKALYFDLLKCIEQLLQENIEYTRERACRWLFDLAMQSPVEQAQSTIALLSNKLGDPDKKLSSRIIFYLEELIKAHPHVQDFVIDEVRGVMTRPGVPERAQYYGLTFYSQLRLSQKRPETAVKLLGIYGIFFKSCVLPAIKEINRKMKLGKKTAEAEQEPPRVAKAVLAGISRALPFTAGHDADGAEVLKAYFEPLMRLSRMSNAGTALLALNLFHQLLTKCDDAFQRGLFYQQLVQFVGEWSRLAKFSNCCPQLFLLLERVFREELKVERLEKLLKRVVNTAVHLDTGFAIRAVQFLSWSLEEKPALKAMLTMPPETVQEGKESALYELGALAKHFDPTVSLLAKSVLRGEGVPKKFSELNAWEASGPKAFIQAVTSLQIGKDTSPALGPLVDKLKGLARKRSAKPKLKKSRPDDDLEGDEDDDDISDFGDDDALDEDGGFGESGGLDGSDGLPSDIGDLEEDIVLESASDDASEPEFEME